ncbi:MAG: nickel insertion protein [Eubacterium sp.]
MEHILFAETTTIGIRRQNMQRTVLTTEQSATVETPLGTVAVKKLYREGKAAAFRSMSVVKLRGRRGCPSGRYTVWRKRNQPAFTSSYTFPNNGSNNATSSVRFSTAIGNWSSAICNSAASRRQRTRKSVKPI